MGRAEIGRLDCFVSRVSCLVSRVSCLVSRVSYLVSRVSCLVSLFRRRVDHTQRIGPFAIITFGGDFDYQGEIDGNIQFGER